MCQPYMLWYETLEFCAIIFFTAAYVGIKLLLFVAFCMEYEKNMCSYVCNYCCVLQNERPLNLWELREAAEVKLGVLGWVYSNWEYFCFDADPEEAEPAGTLFL